MARPKTPLITRESVVNASLAILRAEGVKGLSLRAIGHEIGVNAASIYHHFNDKDEILHAVVAAAIAEVPVPPQKSDLVGWMVDVHMAYYRYFVRNPWLVPLLAQGYLPRRMTAIYHTMVAKMTDSGIDPVDVELSLEAAETLVLGGSLLASVAHNRAPEKSSGRGPTKRQEARFRDMLFVLVSAPFGKTPQKQRSA